MLSCVLLLAFGQRVRRILAIARQSVEHRAVRAGADLPDLPGQSALYGGLLDLDVLSLRSARILLEWVLSGEAGGGGSLL